MRLATLLAGSGIVAAGLVSAGCNVLTGVSDVSTENGSDEPGPGGTKPPVVSEDAVQGPITALNCAFSPANPGVTKGKDFQPKNAAIGWKGFLAGSTGMAPTDVHAIDFYDCVGGKGIHATVYELVKFF